MLSVIRCFLTGLIVTGCGDNLVRIFRQSDKSDNDKDQVELRFERSIDAHSQDVNNVKFHPKIPGLLASASDEGTVKLWKFPVEFEVMAEL